MRTQTISESPAEVGRRLRAADKTYRSMRRTYGKGAFRYQSMNPGWHGPEAGR